MGERTARERSNWRWLYDGRGGGGGGWMGGRRCVRVRGLKGMDRGGVGGRDRYRAGVVGPGLFYALEVSWIRLKRERCRW